MLKTLTRVAAVAVAMSAPFAATAQNTPRAYVLTTAGTGGTYYPVGVALATLAKIHLQNSQGMDMSAISSAGSGENVVLMRENQAQFAILQGLFGAWARNGTGALEEAGPQENLRSIALLWPNVEHYVLRTSMAPTGTVADLQEFSGTFSLGARNSGNEFSNKFMLENFGIDWTQWNQVYQGFGPSVDGMINSTIDGTIIGSGVGVSTMTQVAAQMGDDVTLLNITDEQMAAMDGGAGLYFRFTIPGGTYPGIDADTQTIAQPNFLAVNADVPEEDVYLFTRTIYENLAFLCNIHRATCDMSLDNAMSGLPLTLHPGAARYYEEAGLTIPANIAPVAE
ncbi:TAXI family TRAP transporter solute-binding subunit [Pararhodobacter zhoushanensis]|uniref:TAXI family TRAP transporter solute-binding subunit n=1 Tax=Pararhodobacter zhoushanensis TaxID=2479545 RepID=UPI000F8C78F1|nr:TAXI family TRAP transporter solute-binding subunit [Pararhodobacter zhoushanensis]